MASEAEAPKREPGTASVSHIKRVSKPQAEAKDSANDAWIKSRMAEVKAKRKAQQTGKAVDPEKRAAPKKAARKK
jgi:hypothetical protein